MSVKEKKESAGLLEDKGKTLEKNHEKELPASQKKNRSHGAKKTRARRRQPTKRFAKDRANTVGKEQGVKYLALALAGLFLPPLAPAAWLLTQSLHSFARTHGFLLDNRIYAAWVLGLVSTIFYSFLIFVIVLQYIFVPGYSLPLV